MCRHQPQGQSLKTPIRSGHGLRVENISSCPFMPPLRSLAFRPKSCSRQVLGLSRNADSEAINRTYKRLVRENKDDDAAKARIETAHSAIMMSQLNARMKVHSMPR